MLTISVGNNLLASDGDGRLSKAENRPRFTRIWPGRYFNVYIGMWQQYYKPIFLSDVFLLRCSLLHRPLELQFLTHRSPQRLRDTIAQLELRKTLLDIRGWTTLDSDVDHLFTTQDHQAQKPLFFFHFGLPTRFLDEFQVRLAGDSRFLCVCQNQVHVCVEG